MTIEWLKDFGLTKEKHTGQTRRESFVYFLGDEQSGKTTLLHRFLQFCKTSETKPSFRGANYAFARSRRRDVPVEQQDVVHLWEFGGSREFATQLCHVDNLFLSSKQRGQVTTAVVVIVVDLSKAAHVLENVDYWMKLIQKRRDVIFKKLRSRGSKLPDQLIARARKLAFTNHSDKNSVDHGGIPLVIAAVKQDALMTQPVTTQKMVLGGLRYLAHVHGAHLVGIAGLQQMPSQSDTSSLQKQTLASFLRVLHHLAFHGLEKKLVVEGSNQKDLSRPLLILPGEDALRDIGMPNGQTQPLDIETGLQSYKWTLQPGESDSSSQEERS